MKILGPKEKKDTGLSGSSSTTSATVSMAEPICSASPMPACSRASRFCSTTMDPSVSTLRKFPARCQFDRAMKRIALFNDFQIAENGFFPGRISGHAVEFVDQRAPDSALFLVGSDGLHQRPGKRVVGVDDDVGGVQLPRVFEHGAAHAAAETAQRSKNEQGQGDTEDKDDPLLA
jgi:hypothetical protein